MSCQKAQELIHGYVDGELDLVRSLEVEQHIHECEICARAYRSQTTLRSFVKNDSFYYPAPEKLKKRIGVVVWRLVPRSIRLSGDELLAQEVISDHVRSLQMPGHLTDVLSSDQHTVKPWFAGNVNFAPTVKDFASQDFRLYGGRLEYLNNRTVATLIYQRRLHYINLYIWPSEQASGMNFWAISDLNSVELHEFARLVQQGPL